MRMEFTPVQYVAKHKKTGDMPRATFACIHTTSISVKYVSCAAVVSSIIHDTWKLTQIRVSHVTRATRNLKTGKASSDTNRHTSLVYGYILASMISITAPVVRKHFLANKLP
uniref:(northern house mosquito) hypothetical protein n=1 Tax=Culex pipiens TaxID=7175 RepID=A0A8D8MTC5_CULPI